MEIANLCSAWAAGISVSAFLGLARVLAKNCKLTHVFPHNSTDVLSMASNTLYDPDCFIYRVDAMLSQTCALKVDFIMQHAKSIM